MVTASVNGLSTAATDPCRQYIYIIVATMSMGPALIDEEMDDYVDLTPVDMFHHIAVYWGQ